jgi:hypothetical protein
MRAATFDNSTNLNNPTNSKWGSKFNFGLGLACGLLVSFTAQAHIDKDYDKNGGHWDNGGTYHCHLDGCFPTVSRNQFRSRALSNRDQDLYYVAEDWPYWQMASTCKTVRTAILENTSKVPVTWTNPRQCEIREGLWVDAYTGEEFTRAAALEIDHIIPPQYANASNGYQWDYGKRVQFANDPFNLIPVGRETHRKKRERSISYYEPREEFLCEYANTWNSIAEKYDLDLFSRDISRINRILESCSDQIGPGVED